METIKATPTKSGNGLRAGEVYTFTPTPDCYAPQGKPSLFETVTERGHVKYVSRDTLEEGRPCPHLWDGRNWLAAGTWQIISREV